MYLCGWSCISTGHYYAYFRPTCVEQIRHLWCFLTATVLSSSAPLSVCRKHPLCGTMPHSAPPASRLYRGTAFASLLSTDKTYSVYAVFYTLSDQVSLEGNIVEMNWFKGMFPSEQLRAKAFIVLWCQNKYGKFTSSIGILLNKTRFMIYVNVSKLKNTLAFT